MNIDKDWTKLCTTRDTCTITVSSAIPSELDLLEHLCMWLELELKDKIKSNNMRYVYGRVVELKNENEELKNRLLSIKKGKNKK